MRKLLLLITVCSFAAAGMLAFSRKEDNPFTMSFTYRLSNKQYDGQIGQLAFSPDGAKLAFTVSNQKEKYKKNDIYIYEIDTRRLRRLDNDDCEAGISWTPDSRRLQYNIAEAHRWYLSVGRVYDVERSSVVERVKIPFHHSPSPDGRYQMFYNYAKNEVLLKETGKREWRKIPQEVREQSLHWSRLGDSLLYCDRMNRNVNKYDIEEGIVTTIAHADDFELTGFISCSPVTDDIFIPTSRALKAYRGIVVRRLDLNTGAFTYSYDSGLDPDTNAIVRVFVPSRENAVYFSVYGTETLGKLKGGPPRLILLDMATGVADTLITEDHVRDYCVQRDIFAVASKKDTFKSLFLFDAKTRSFEQIFPPKYPIEENTLVQNGFLSGT